MLKSLCLVAWAVLLLGAPAQGGLTTAPRGEGDMEPIRVRTTRETASVSAEAWMKLVMFPKAEASKSCPEKR